MKFQDILRNTRDNIKIFHTVSHGEPEKEILPINNSHANRINYLYPSARLFEYFGQPNCRFGFFFFFKFPASSSGYIRGTEKHSRSPAVASSSSIMSSSLIVSGSSIESADSIHSRQIKKKKKKKKIRSVSRLTFYLGVYLKEKKKNLKPV